MDGVTKLVPVPMALPPLDVAYQFKVPALAVALSVTTPVSHLEPGVVEVTAGPLLTVAVTAVLAEAQLPLAACT